ncbi:MAG: hypothetical protein AAF502_23925 [Bacteroidota bacterium]
MKDNAPSHEAQTDQILDQEQEANQPTNAKTWLKRLGFAGFMFFFIKGLVWLAIFFGLGKVIKDWFS